MTKEELLQKLSDIERDTIECKKAQEKLFEDVRTVISALTSTSCIREKSVVNDVLAKLFPNLVFEECNPELDYAGDIDYVAKVGKHQLGIQVKLVMDSDNLEHHSMSERMQASFNDFTEEFGGKVFVVYNQNGEIVNPDVIESIRKEIARLQSL
ncbi:MAG: hypothetical protein IKZ48_05050 [Prevotella sp.]|nr:hypothetical protein [Prevotella sp.]